MNVRNLSIMILAAVALTACKPGERPRPPAQPETADAGAPRSCRDWTIKTAMLQCSALVMRGAYVATNAKRIAAAEDRLSRYGGLAHDLCKDAGDATDTRDAAARWAIEDASTRVKLDKITEGSAMISLCHEGVMKIIARGEEEPKGRAAVADLRPVDDTPKQNGED
jgi:hypothetical protein